MDIFLAEMPSYTYAVKAQRLLAGYGFPSQIKRRSSGCGFDLIFRTNAALKILDKFAVPYELKNGGAL